MNYNITNNKFNEYVEECRQKILAITNTTEADYKQVSQKIINQVAQDPILSLKATKTDIVKLHRLDMIKIKIDHTMRMIESIAIINEELGIKFDLKIVTKVAILLHDIGRFEQATWTGSYRDTEYPEKAKKVGDYYNTESGILAPTKEELEKSITNHGESGYHIFKQNKFEVDDQYVPIIGESIHHHVNLTEAPHLQHRFSTKDEIKSLNINEIATGKFELNDAEKQAVSLITQLVADIDKADILYQCLTDETPIYREAIVDDSGESLDKIAIKWGISKEEILEYNPETTEYQYNIMDEKTIKIPLKNVEPSKLEVSQEFKNMFYEFCNNHDKNSEIAKKWANLQQLQNKDFPEWSFIHAMWWKVSKFIKDINFYSAIVSLEETKLLEKIYDKMPDKYKPLIQEPIEYAISKLIPNIKNASSDRLYTRY